MTSPFAMQNLRRGDVIEYSHPVLDWHEIYLVLESRLDDYDGWFVSWLEVCRETPDGRYHETTATRSAPFTDTERSSSSAEEAPRDEHVGVLRGRRPAAGRRDSL